MENKRSDTARSNDRRQVVIRMPAELHQALRTLAFATDEKVNDLVCTAVADYIGREGHRETVDGLLKQAQERYRVVLDKLADL